MPHGLQGILMPYKKAHANRQKEGLNLPLEWYFNDANHVALVDGIEIISVEDLNPAHVLAYIVKRGGAISNKLTHDYTVVLSDYLDDKPVLEKFIATKELMHCYFAEYAPSATSNGLIFEAHMRELFGNSATTSHQVQAENTAFWMAVGLICPENERIRLKEAYGGTDREDQDIGGMLGIPPGMVSLLFSDQFDDEVTALLI